MPLNDIMIFNASFDCTIRNDAGFEMTRFHEHPYEQWIKESEFWLNNITPNMSYQMRVLKQFPANIVNGTYRKHNVNCCSIIANKMK